MKLNPITAIALLLLTAVGSVGAQDETARYLLHELGGPFIIYRTNVKRELKLTDGQKQKLMTKLPGIVQNSSKVFESVKNLPGGEREQKIQPFRQNSSIKFWVEVKQILKPDQLKRFQQLELQHEGPAALLGRPEIAKKLKTTEKQRKQFISLIQDMQKTIEPMIKEAQSRGSAQDILPKVIKIRRAYDRKIEAVMNASQKKQWNEMLGKQFDVFIDN